MNRRIDDNVTCAASPVVIGDADPMKETTSTTILVPDRSPPRLLRLKRERYLSAITFL